MTIKDLSRKEFDDLLSTNKWLEQQVGELVQEQISFGQSEEFNLIGAKAFDYHDHYTSFYLTVPVRYGVKDGHSVAGKLDRDYLNEENAKLYDELCELADKWDNMTYDEQDEHRDIDEKMDEVCKRLADGVTEQLQAWENWETYVDVKEQEIEMILSGDRYISDLEVEDYSKIKEVIMH